MNFEREGKGIRKRGRYEDMCWCMSLTPFTIYWCLWCKYFTLYDKVFEWNCVVDVIVFVPSNSGSCTKAPVDEEGNDPDGILIT